MCLRVCLCDCVLTCMCFHHLIYTLHLDGYCSDVQTLMAYPVLL